ncbi:FecR family protein [Entomospira culicis]|uniref:FecR domain-containing protein n=1 Tax=Entomospira culicis TaxID=2719989 RepID=A0A968KZR8_9SPIO|nr:FecR family protein [Entomospira culicis]NIZ19489.1 FecR domain-containing protein [Entomospira culicis]NIZ69606.1 FecR domain-containing protein [Entomospira culicis]WDI36717.1 FecR family protein [Entomospira culicis]WDI38346.1 FecR family protein [Entomospira culicis]
MRQRSLFFFLLIPLLVNCTVGSSSTKDRFNVVVSAYAGEVVVHRGEERYPIKLSMHLELGDMIEVPEDGYVQLLFRDGAVVRGSGGSTLGIPDEGIVRLVQGESFYHVERQQARSFVVQTHNAKIEVVGTQFMVHAKADETQVALLNGEIMLDVADKKIALHAGEELLITHEDGAISAITALYPETVERFAEIYALKRVPAKVTEEEEDESELLDLRARIAVQGIELESLREQLLQKNQEIAKLVQEMQVLSHRAERFEDLYNTERRWVEKYKELLEAQEISVD